MTILHLGVIDIPYAAFPGPKPTTKVAKAKRRAKIKARKASGFKNQTTGEVADILEAKYHIMESFFHSNETKIVTELTEAVRDALESLLMGAPHTISMTAQATSEIDNSFKSFLSLGEMERLGIPGVPTMAALRGVSHRFLHPYARRAPRPSFIDTGLYQSSFRSWVD